MDADLAEMKRETTLEAFRFIKANREMSPKLEIARRMSPKNAVKYLKNASLIYAHENNGIFGELFVTELELVKWRDMLSEGFDERW